MATAVPFDTLALARKLRERAHFAPEDAEGTAEALAEAMTSTELVTRDYLDARLSDVKADILKWVVGLLLAQTAVFAALLKWLGH
ncbi:MAG: hypothetical protein ABT940_04025 [Alphaproteobacteria bacterium]